MSWDGFFFFPLGFFKIPFRKEPSASPLSSLKPIPLHNHNRLNLPSRSGINPNTWSTNFSHFPQNQMKYVLISGGVVSGLGKGVTASSIGVVLKACGLRVTSIKIGSLFPSIYSISSVSCSRCSTNSNLSTAPMQIPTWTSTLAPCLPSSMARFLCWTTAERFFFFLLLLVFISPLHALISMSPSWCSISTLCAVFWLGERLIWIWEITSASSMSRLPRITTSPLEKYTRCMLAFALLYLCNGYGTQLQGAREWFCFRGLTVSFRVTSLFSRRNVKEIILGKLFRWYTERMPFNTLVAAYLFYLYGTMDSTDRFESLLVF